NVTPPVTANPTSSTAVTAPNLRVNPSTTNDSVTVSPSRFNSSTWFMSPPGPAAGLQQTPHLGRARPPAHQHRVPFRCGQLVWQQFAWHECGQPRGAPADPRVVPAGLPQPGQPARQRLPLLLAGQLPQPSGDGVRQRRIVHRPTRLAAAGNGS